VVWSDADVPARRAARTLTRQEVHGMKGPHPFRKLQQRILEEVKSAARDDLIALSAGVTDHHADVSVQAAGRTGNGGGAAGNKRGPGARAGRRDYSRLPRLEVFWDFPDGGYRCPECRDQEERPRLP